MIEGFVGHMGTGAAVRAMAEADDQAYQDGAARFQHMEGVMTPCDWLDDELAVKRLELELADRAPLFSLAFRFWWPTALILALLILHAIGVLHMSHDESQPPSPPPAEAPAPESPAKKPLIKPLQTAIQRLADATIQLSTHPDTGMFFFDAQELTVNEKLQGLKLQALVDLLCAKGIIQRHEFENRLEELVLQRAKMLEEGAKRLAFTAMTGGKPVNGSGN
jgi:hypothetical protein